MRLFLNEIGRQLPFAIGLTAAALCCAAGVLWLILS